MKNICFDSTKKIWNKQRLDRTIKFQEDHLTLLFMKRINQDIGQAAMLEIEPNVYGDAVIGMS